MEKLNIYVPDSIAEILDNDAMMFEVYKKDGKTLNRNKFLGMLISGYNDDYKNEIKDSKDAIMTVLGKYTIPKEENPEEIADSILNNAIFPQVSGRTEKHMTRLSFKPTKNNETLVQDYITEQGTAENSTSDIFRRIFMCYCAKPFSKREQTIFKEKYDLLQEACKKASCIIQVELKDK